MQEMLNRFEDFLYEKMIRDEIVSSKAQYSR